MNDCERARALLAGNTVCLVKGEKVYTSAKRGIAPVLEFIKSGEDFTGFSAADKIVGKAAALLYAYMGVTYVYAEVISSAAIGALESSKIRFEYGTAVERIINRSGDGVCPMEQTVMNISSPREAVAALEEKLRSLRGE